MRCENCPALATIGYEYPEEYCGAGVPDEKCCDFKDGGYGCKFPLNAIIQRLRKADEAEKRSWQFVAEWNKELEYREKGIDVRDIKEPFLSDAKHCIGLDYVKPYKRHGKLFYKPYRNYYNVNSNDKVWSILKDIGYAEEYRPEYFRLTDAGFDWLHNCTGIIFKERER